jgi:hypothetical protein
MIEFKRIEESVNLPLEWDELADNYFQQAKFLIHTETYNPCQQRYYICYENGKMVSAAIVYSLLLDILTFVKIKSRVKMNIVGIPCSVSSQGIFGEIDAIEVLKKHIFEIEKGLVLFLNLNRKPTNRSFSSGKTLPTIVLRNHYANWVDYLAALRSSYRHRLNHINRENKDLRFEKMLCCDFTEEMFRLYLEVYKRSSAKLEKLTFRFFKNLPSEFKLTVCFKNNSIIGWNAALEDRNTLFFFLGGIDYNYNKTYNTYLRLLTALIKDGIEKKADSIELGQTAEIPKMRLGGQHEIRYMEARHSSFVLNGLLKLFSPLLVYRRRLESTNALRRDMS